MRRRIFATHAPGPLSYRAVLQAQRDLARARIIGAVRTDWLLLLEHEPVVTRGRGAQEEHVTASPALLAARGIDEVEIERGGDVTYHGPGQLVGYPILDLRGFRRDLHWYMRRLEEALIRALAQLDLDTFRVAAHTGVWVGDGPGERGELELSRREAGALMKGGTIRKVASIGVHVSRWVTWHGFALNVTDESRENFGLIVPCGLPGVCMTSLEAEGVRLERGVESQRLRDAVLAGFAIAFETPVEWVPWEQVSEVGGQEVFRRLSQAAPAISVPRASA